MPSHLQLLNEKLMAVGAGDILRLLITMPPRHGKSWLTSCYFPAWFLGINPDCRVILSSYEADYASSWGRKTREVLERNGHSFGINVSHSSSASDRWDIANRLGGMNTAGVGGPITGKGADLLIIDDPVKNAEEASSETYRSKAWDWYTSTAYTRLEPNGRVVLIQTRWHTDDLAGRILAEANSGGERWEILNLPALAEADDILGRKPNDALWPARYNEPKLREIQRTVGNRWFAALYQQRPIPAEGGMFRATWFKLAEPPTGLTKVRYWDLAATEAKKGTDPDWTVGALLGRSVDRKYYILDIRRTQSSPAAVEDLIRHTAELDGRDTPVWMEQEPGSSGIGVISHYTRNVLPGFAFKGDRVTGDKSVRAAPLAAAAETGNVFMAAGAWNRPFLDELEVFPLGKHDDQVDAVSGAFGKLVLPLAKLNLFA